MEPCLLVGWEVGAVAVGCSVKIGRQSAGELATWSSRLHGVVASMAGQVGMQKGGLSVHEPKRNAYVAVHAREKEMVGLAGGSRPR